MPTKMSTIFASAMFIGCSEPALRPGPGRVTSTASASRRAAFSLAASSLARSSSFSSSAARTSFTSWPIFGRSSGGSLPMPRKRPVNSPFLPSTATRICSSAALALASSMFMSTRSRISRSIFSIRYSLLNLCFAVRVQGIKKRPRPKGRSRIAPLYHPNSPAHAGLSS